MANVDKLKQVQGSPMPGTVVVCAKATFSTGTATQVVLDGGASLGDHDTGVVVVSLDEPFSQLISVSCEAKAPDGDADNQVAVSVSAEDVDNPTTPTVTLALVKLEDPAILLPTNDLTQLGISLVLRNSPVL